MALVEGEEQQARVMMACSRQPTARMREGGDHAMTSSVAAMAHVISGGIHFATTPWPPPPSPFVTRHTPVSQTLTLGRRHCMSALLVGVHHALHLDATALSACVTVTWVLLTFIETQAAWAAPSRS